MAINQYRDQYDSGDGSISCTNWYRYVFNNSKKKKIKIKKVNTMFSNATKYTFVSLGTLVVFYICNVIFPLFYNPTIIFIPFAGHTPYGDIFQYFFWNGTTLRAGAGYIVSYSTVWHNILTFGIFDLFLLLNTTVIPLIILTIIFVYLFKLYKKNVYTQRELKYLFLTMLLAEIASIFYYIYYIFYVYFTPIIPFYKLSYNTPINIDVSTLSIFLIGWLTLLGSLIFNYFYYKNKKSSGVNQT